MATYGFGRLLSDVTFEKARENVTDALKSEGFGVLTEIDVSQTLKKKLNLDFRRYIILGACNPGLAHRALIAEPEIGLLLPCNVVLQEEPGGVAVSIADPRAMFAMSEILRSNRWWPRLTNGCAEFCRRSSDCYGTSRHRPAIPRKSPMNEPTTNTS